MKLSWQKFLVISFLAFSLLLTGCNPFAREEKSPPSPVSEPILKVIQDVKSFVQAGEHFSGTLRIASDEFVRNVLLQLSIPSELEVIKNIPEGEIKEGLVSWNVEVLKPGEEKEFKYFLKAKKGGNFQLIAFVSGLKCEEVTAKILSTLNVTSALGITAGIRDVPGVQEEGGEVLFLVNLEGQGATGASDVGLILKLGEGLEFVKAESPIAYSHDEGLVHFATIPFVKDEEGVEIKVFAKAKRAGVWTTRASIKFDSGSFIAEESTTITARR